jgi:prevent-host-death family protein
MKTASVSELKSRLSEFLRQVKGGDSVIVMDRNRPVALLGPYHEVGADLAALRDAGLVRIGSGQFPGDFWTRSLPEDPEGLMLQALLEEREEGR